MGMSEKITALERRIKALENNRGASLRYCEVTSVEKNGYIRVKLLDGDGMVSQPLRTLHRRTLKDKDQCFPDVGEHVACLFAGQGFESGVILGPMYSDKNTTPDQPIHYDYKQFEDGTVIYYDRKEHKYVVIVKGDIEVACTKSITVQANGDITATAKGNITAKAKGILVLEGHGGVTMRGPFIAFTGIDGGQCVASINACLSLKGDLEQEGNQSVSGSISASGAISGNPVNGCPH